jgi:hypothetical protein
MTTLSTNRVKLSPGKTVHPASGVPRWEIGSYALRRLPAHKKFGNKSVLIKIRAIAGMMAFHVVQVTMAAMVNRDAWNDVFVFWERRFTSFFGQKIAFYFNIVKRWI